MWSASLWFAVGPPHLCGPYFDSFLPPGRFCLWVCLLPKTPHSKKWDSRGSRLSIDHPLPVPTPWSACTCCPSQVQELVCLQNDRTDWQESSCPPTLNAYFVLEYSQLTILLVSGVDQSDHIMHIHGSLFFKLFSFLCRVPWSIQ